MNISRQVCFLMAGAGIFLFGCRNSASTPGVQAQTVQAGSQPSEAELVDGFRRTHDARDLPGISKLFCWDGVTAEMRKITEDRVQEMFDEKIVSIKLTDEHPKGRSNLFTRNGVTYGLNLPVVKELVSQTESSGTNDYPVGVKDGQYVIALMAPVSNSGAAPATAPTSENGQASSAADVGQPAVVPAKTDLTVRLMDVVSVKTIDNGGTFSATFKDAVQVGGATAIPAGTIAQGAVTKEKSYGPEMTLTSVTVNGKSYKVKTAAISFNEQISFPVGSEHTFHLTAALDLTK
ncbi:MAG TPA: hypothetical protein VGI16_05140 [Candidatus Acidoferrum sp.]|jgi:hypothetical protein